MKILFSPQQLLRRVVVQVGGGGGNVEKILYDFYLYLILISIMDEGSTIKVMNIDSKRLKS